MGWTNQPAVVAPISDGDNDERSNLIENSASSGERFAGCRQGGVPLTVRQAASYLGVSVQTVYLWVERKQIPHLRVMGRNIRFLKSDLEPFRAQFKQEVENGKA
jgi:excisionase family DNA binding protein